MLHQITTGIINDEMMINTGRDQLPGRQVGALIPGPGFIDPDMNGDTLSLLAPNRFVLNSVKKRFKNRIEDLLTQYSKLNIAHIYLQVGSRYTSQQAAASKNKQDIASGDVRKPVSLSEMLAEKSKQPNGQRQPPNPRQIRTQSNQHLSGVHTSPLNPKFTFNDFVPGITNRVAHAATSQIAEEGGYNPLYIYGGVGIGKTHLMQALGHTLIRRKPNSKIVYLHSERFVADMIKALQSKKMEQFKRFYRSVDVLLLDDIQFLAGKERSQEEFSHAMNALLEGQQQLVVTSHCMPKALNGLDEGLKSRLSSGLSIAVALPDQAARAQILQNKAAHSNIKLCDDVAEFIAGHVQSNVRELEGALHRLLASARFMKTEISLDFTQEVLNDLIVEQFKNFSVADIQKVVAEYFNLSMDELCSRRRQRNIVRPRQIAMSLARELTGQSLASLGDAFQRDRSTVMHGHKAIQQLLSADAQIQQDYQRLLSQLS
jgi:chromosomal replication initiator protein